MGVFSKHLVGIFSMDGEENYRWVTDLLLSPGFRPLVHDVRPVNISSGAPWRLAEEISKCTFAILYHTQNRGRLNITDVTDSLYDQELRELCKRRGRQQVAVLVDDVAEDAEAVLVRIALEQPLIRECAEQLLVFDQREKPICSSNTASYQQREHRTKEKIKRLRSQLAKGRTINKMIFVLLGFVIIGVVIIVLSVELSR